MKSYKWLLLWCVALLVLACTVKFMHASKALTQLIGLIELLLAIATGIAFGIKAAKKTE
jgi:hypothetical protein